MTIPVSHVSLKGNFTAQVRNIFSGEVGPEIEVDNMLLDAFFNSWVGGTTASYPYFSHCDLDGSSTPVTAGDTTITKVGPARASFTGEEPLQTLGVGQWKSGKQYVFAVATAPAAVNALTIWNSASGGIMSARANLASTLNLIAGDILTVKHYITATVDPADRTGVMTIDSINYPYTIRWLNFDGPFATAVNHGTPWNVNTNGGYNTFTGAYMGMGSGAVAFQTQNLPNQNANLGNTTDFPSTAGDDSLLVPVVTADAYVSGSFYRDIQLTFPYAEGNMPAGIGNLLVPYGGAYYAVATGFFMNFATTRLPKTNRNELKLKFRFSWGR